MNQMEEDRKGKDLLLEQMSKIEMESKQVLFFNALLSICGKRMIPDSGSIFQVHCRLEEYAKVSHTALSKLEAQLLQVVKHGLSISHDMNVLIEIFFPVHRKRVSQSN
jgi:hypothetical protein